MATIDPITGEVIEDPLDPALTLPPPEPVLTATEPLAEPVLTDTTTTTTERGESLKASATLTTSL